MAKKNKIENEIIKIKKELEKDPNNVSLYKELGKLSLKLEGKSLYKEAIQCYKKAYKLQKTVKLAKKIANLYKENSELAYAYKYYLKAIKLSPEDEKLFLKAKECAFEYYLEDYVEKDHKKEIEKRFLDEDQLKELK